MAGVINRKILLVVLLTLVSLFSLSSTSVLALNANFTIADGISFINLANNNTINITIGAVEGNITNITFKYNAATGASPADLYINNSNGSNLADVSFADITAYPGGVTRNYNFTFNNASTGTLIVNGTTKSFWFNVAARSMFQQAGALLALTINASNASGYGNITTINFFPAFTFTGYVVNETGCATCWQNGTNVTIYGVTQGQNAPPTNTELASALTNASGFFRLNRINASSSFNGFKLKTIFYNTTGTATKVGMIMPEFPSFMYYGGAFGNEGFDMTLNGATFYLQSAHTINMSANNLSSGVSFGYEMIDQALGFPVESQPTTQNTNVQVVIPAGRGYTVSFFRMPNWPGSSIGYIMNGTLCGGNDFMNNSHCPAPPKTYSISAGSATAGNVTIINQSLVVRRAYVDGCLTPASGTTNNSAINVTSIRMRMLPWTTDAGSFVPPSNADDGSINITQNINYTFTASGCTYAFYNVSLLNQTGYMIEFYAKNASNEAGNPGTANNLAAFLNVSGTGVEYTTHMNVTLYKLAGAYTLSNISGLSINTSLMRINAINSSGGAVTTNVNADMKVRNTRAGLGTVFYIIDQNVIVNGSFYMPILNNSNYVKAMVFSQNGPPRETTVNISNSEANLTVLSMNMEKGFKEMNASGGFSDVNMSTSPISLRFLRNTAECSVPNVPSNSSCVITEMNASSFNPLKALLAGKVNMEVKITSTNVSLIFNDYDMLSAKQPPMDSIMDDNASARGTTSGSAAVSDVWNFGSFAPADSYANVTITVPYSDTATASNYLNDSVQINMSIPVLYDENNRVTWNKTAGFDYVNLSDDFVKYNNSYYRGLLGSGGMVCLNNSFNETCFVNKSSNYISMHIPHFSTIGALVSGSAASSSTSSSSSSGGGGGGTEKKYTISENQFTMGYTQTLAIGDVIRVNISNLYHTVTLAVLKNNSASITVSSAPQTKVFSVGDINKFDVTDDGNYDLQVTLNSVSSSKANITVAKVSGVATAAPSTGGGAGTTAGAGETGGAGTGSLGEEKMISSSTWWTIAVIVIIVVLAIVVALLITKYQQYKEKSKSRKVKVYGTSPFSKAMSVIGVRK